ncbi:MAG: phosphoribosyltransferase family protein [Coriobacteriia bacterium]|nr:phosphoribosyltransferase family protein [Coriobacteriia bacterium]
MFSDRVDAGEQLSRPVRALLAEPPGGDDAALILGIPRGGVVVAAQVARALGCQLAVAVAAKVGAPGYAEYAVGAVAADGEVVANPAAGYSLGEVEALAGPARAKVQREVARWSSGSLAPAVAGKTAVLVDDGLATGLTALAAVGWLRRAGAARIVVAAPVAPPDTVRMLQDVADDVVIVEVPEHFAAVGQFYRRFGQTDDAEVDAALGL